MSTPTAKPAVSKQSKFFRVAVEGATTDGRVIDRSFIEQMAATFNRQLYGARVWLEHLRSTLPDGPFKAYGDVLAVKAEEVVLGGAKKLALFAQISPTPELVAMNQARQKIYTSIEINPKFADTGEAYLDGLACDFIAPAFGTPMAICQALDKSYLQFDQLIVERVGGAVWVHLGIAAEGKTPRRQVLTIDSRGTRIGLWN